MRRDSKKVGRAVRTTVEQLEGRMLLSVWAGTWKIQGIEAEARSGGTTGSASYQAMSLTARIVDAAPGQYSLDVSGSGVSAHFTMAGNDSKIQMTSSSSGDAQETLDLYMVDPGVILVVHSSVDYNSPNQTLSAAHFFGGSGTQKAAPTVPFVWEGDYHAYDNRLEADSGSSAVTPGSQTVDVTVTQVGPGQYKVAAAGDSDPKVYSVSGSKLVHKEAGTDGNGYEYKYEQIWRGAYGRFYHLGANASIDTSTGQLRHASFDVAYTDPRVNVAPVLDKIGAPSFDAINEDDGTSAGTSVGDLLGRGGSTYIYDANGNAKGIAVVGADTKRGKWQYSLDGTTWQDTGKVTGASALLLDSTARLRFVPNANYFGTLTKGITFRAWDQSSGTNGGRASVNASGKTTAFSQASDVASLVVNPVNDAPVFTGANVALVYTHGAKPVSIFKGMKLSDVDSKLISSATVQFSGGYAADTDVIAYHGPTAIQATIDPAAGTVTLSSATPLSLSQYAAALKGIVFSTPNQHADVVMSFTAVDDLGLGGVAIQRTLQIL